MKSIQSRLGMIFTALVLLNSCGSQQEKQPESKPIPVQTVMVHENDIALPINTSGKLYSSLESKLSFKIPGIIDKIYVREGQTVRKNTILATLNLVEMQARVHQAQSGYQKAERDLERVKRLYADSVVTLELMQNAKTARDVADAELKVAAFNLRHAQIMAPENGKILKKLAEEGELINSGTPLFLFGADQEGWVIRAAVTDRQIISLEPGNRADVQFDAYGNTFFPAEVNEMQAVANPYTGTFEVELKLKPTQLKLYSGFVGRVKIIPNEKKSYFVLPVQALVEGDGQTGYIFVADRAKKQVKRQAIKVAAIFEDQLLIKYGVQDGQEIVTYGAPYLTDNSTIEFVEHPLPVQD